MNTKSILTILLFLASFYGISQIEGKTSSNANKFKYGNATKLQVLKATKYERVPNDKILDFGKRINEHTQLLEIPSPPAPGSTALNVTLTPEAIRKNGTHLTFHGYYDGKTISIGRDGRIRDSWLLLDYQSAKRKTYRITVDFTADFNWSNKNVTTAVFLGGANDRAIFKIEKGLNVLDFLVEANHTGKSQIALFSTSSVKNGNRPLEGYYQFKINEVKIRQLQD